MFENMNIIFNILFVFLGLCCGVFIFYLIVRPKLQNIKTLNVTIENQNNQLQQENIELINQKNLLLNDIQNFKNQINFQKNSIQDLKSQAEKAGEEFYNSNYKLAQERLDQAAEAMSKKYQDYEEECKNIYLQTCQDSSEEYQVLIASFQEKIQNLQKSIEESNIKLNDLRSIVQAATEENIRRAKIEEQDQFYKVNLTEQSLKEIQKIKEIIPYLSDSEPINKVIWKVYYEKPTNDLIGRVVGEGVKTGIYKITDPASGKCYVGQSVNIAERFKQHIKRGLGAETPTKNKLYPAMQAIGIENFTFELIEECSREQLDQKEDYWQDYFGAKIWGYSIK